MTHFMQMYDRVRTAHNQTAARITCTATPGCKEYTDVVLTNTSLPPEFVAKKARQRKWLIDKHGYATCPTCAGIAKVQKQQKEAPPMKPNPDRITEAFKEDGIGVADGITALPPRQPTPTDLRRIMREIDDNWDEAKGQYSGSATDQSIADNLKVPRAWVADERKRAFGDSQRNDAMDKLVADAKELHKECQLAIQRAFDAAATAETHMKHLDVLIKKLEKLQ